MADRTEQHDLAGKHPEEVETLTGQWRQWAMTAKVLPKPKPKRKKKATTKKTSQAADK